MTKNINIISKEIEDTEKENLIKEQEKIMDTKIRQRQLSRGKTQAVSYILLDLIIFHLQIPDGK